MAKVYKLPTLQKARKKANRPEPEPRHWECSRCKHDIGVATSTSIKVRLSPVIKGLKVTGGYLREVCAHCWTRGITTPLIR